MIQGRADGKCISSSDLCNYPYGLVGFRPRPSWSSLPRLGESRAGYRPCTPSLTKNAKDGAPIRGDKCPRYTRSAYFGCGTMRRYGLGDFQPAGYFCCASSFDTDGKMMTSSPCFQFTGVATLCFAVS